MISRSQRSKRRDAALSTLDGFIQTLNVAKDTCGVPPAQIALASACILLTVIKNTMNNKDDFIDLGLSCADVCEALDRGLNRRRSGGFSESVKKAIEKLTTTVADIQRRVDEKNSRSLFSRAFNAQNDMDMIAAWKEDLNRMLRIFNTELSVDTNVTVTDSHREVTDMRQEVTTMHQDVLEIKEGVFNKLRSTQARSGTMDTMGSAAGHTHGRSLGELPPPAPKALFGRETLVEEVIALTQRYEPIALVGTGGIGKTSIALTVLHHDQTKDWFGDNRRFIRCDKFTPSLSNFLARLSEVIGAGTENPKDLAPLRPFLSSNKILIVFDNAESIFDPEGMDSGEILAAVEELCRFDKICVCITSRITTVPEHCKHPEIPTLSMDAARNIFYEIYNGHDRSDSIDALLERLEFHPLSITLLATTARHNKWGYDRLIKKWNALRGQVLRTDTNKSLAASLQLSLESPSFLKLGPDARDLLGVIAFFPQGINEDHIEWLFPTSSDVESTFDKFCALSLAYRADGYITMLAPIRDHLAPQDQEPSPLLCATKDRYFSQLSVPPYPGSPRSEGTQWILLEDVNVEHLLDIFTSIDPTTDSVWNACCHFLDYLYWHKPRNTVLASKIEALPEDYPLKPRCLEYLSALFGYVGNHTEEKRILTHALTLNPARMNRHWPARGLMCLSFANRELGLYGEAIKQAREASEIFEQLGSAREQATSLNSLALALHLDNQLDAAEVAAFRAISLIDTPEGRDELRLCQLHNALGPIYRSKGEKAKAIHHFKTAINIASSIKSDNDLFWSHLGLTNLFLDQGESNEADTHVEQAKSYAVNDAYNMGRAMEAQARIWAQQSRLEDAKVEVSRAVENFERLGATKDAERSRGLLQGWNEQ